MTLSSRYYIKLCFSKISKILAITPDFYYVRVVFAWSATYFHRFEVRFPVPHWSWSPQTKLYLRWNCLFWFVPLLFRNNWNKFTFHFLAMEKMLNDKSLSEKSTTMYILYIRSFPAYIDTCKLRLDIWMCILY